MSIKAIFFDMGGTLERVWYTTEQRVKATAGLQDMLLSEGIAPELSEAEFYRTFTAGYRRYHRWSVETMQELSPFQVWSQFILAGLSIDETRLAPIAEELMLQLETTFFQRELRPEVPQVLEIIRSLGLKIGLISNVCSRGLVPANLQKYGIWHYFDPIILSSEYGRRKPDPSIFHYAARLANVPTSLCAHVGDRIARDIVGARNAGFSLLVQIINDFDHGESDEGAEPDAIIKHFNELPELLKSPGAAPQHRSRGIRALLFDAGDILYYRAERGRNLQSFLEEIGVAARKVPHEQKEKLKKQAYHGEITQDQYRERYLNLYGISDPALIELGKARMDADDNNITFFEGVPQTLKGLKENGFMLGIITDTAMPVHVKLEWFERGGFGDVWDSIISSKDMGVQKPDPKTYQAALQQLGLSADEAVFVGHQPVELEGARVVGMKTIAFNYDPSACADYFIEKFEDLLRVPIIASEEMIKQGPLNA